MPATKQLTLTTVLEPRGPAAAVILTDEQAAALGGGSKAFPVTITIAGTSRAARLARMGGENMVGLSKAARTELGVEIGEKVDVTITFDDAPREVDVPPALAEALATDPALGAAFDRLSYTKRKEHARSVADAKKDETRARRVAAVVASLTADTAP
uniref:YdeI/OmpD-associated family protein n=1 Tax=Gordonia sp. B7-2 TaxID=3420932 RepID=UPI003D8D577E